MLNFMNYDDTFAYPYIKNSTIKIILVVTAQIAAIKAIENIETPKISLHLNLPKFS